MNDYSSQTQHQYINISQKQHALILPYNTQLLDILLLLLLVLLGLLGGLLLLGIGTLVQEVLHKRRPARILGGMAGMS